MKRISFLGLALALFSSVSSTAQSAVIINEVYGGGGANSGSPAYNRDFIEIYNTSAADINLAGWRISYASATGNFLGTNGTFSNAVVFAEGSFIGANDYILIVTGGTGTAGVPVPNANFYNGTTSGASLSGAGGSVGIFDANNVVIDVVGYGASNTNPLVDTNLVPKAETARVPFVANTANSLSRTNFIDTNDNSLDFSTLTTPTPTAGVNSVVVVPEPGSMALLAAVGIGGVVARRRMKKQKALSLNS